MKTTNQIDREANEKKAKEIAHDYFRRGQLGLVAIDTESAGYDCAMQAMQWKDARHKEQRRIIRNHWQEWEIEQLTAFAVHLNKRGAFRDDLCMDFEHEAQSFIEMQNNKEL